jgi:hypothetical protein
VEHRLVDPSIDALDLEVFPGLRADSIPGYRVGPPTGLLPFRSLTDYRLPRGARVNTLAARLAATSHEVFGSFSTTHPSSPPIAGLPHPLRSVSRVSHPPDGFLLDRLPALFHAGALMEFLTLQSFSLTRSCHASRRAPALLPFTLAAVPAHHG